LLLATGCVGNAAAPGSDPEPTAVTLPAAPPPAGPEDEQTPPPAVEEPEESDPPGEPEPEEPYIRTIDPSKPMVALTFDDGPDGITTGQILDILEKNHALATFFEIGRNVAYFPEPVKRAADMGCEIASHSNAHKNLSKLGKQALLKDLDTADQAFTNAGVDAPTLVRPPYGAVNSTVKNSTGRTIITWTVDTLDWKSRDAQTVIDYVQNYGDLDGEIVLLHSIYSSTVDAVEVLVPWLQEQGYQLVTVTELMAYYYGELPQPNCFYGYTYFSTHGRTDTPLELPVKSEEELPEQSAEDAPAGDEAPAAPQEDWVPAKVEAEPVSGGVAPDSAQP
ncbi:MAG: polysaccharide deacetylase family protein, partial [Oscillospiraceae bacterium]|nr:polysaccharide deacetylase family protein [Oscillospiraceae bacterium]